MEQLSLKRSVKHLDYLANNENAGGPKEVEMLFSVDEIKSDLSNYEIIELEERLLNWMKVFHNGKGSVIRFVGQKNKTR